jgi:hypothetical protein
MNTVTMTMKHALIEFYTVLEETELNARFLPTRFSSKPKWFRKL